MNYCHAHDFIFTIFSTTTTTTITITITTITTITITTITIIITLSRLKSPGSRQSLCDRGYLSTASKTGDSWQPLSPVLHYQCIWQKNAMEANHEAASIKVTFHRTLPPVAGMIEAGI